MSDTHDEAHTGAIKNPKQFLTSTILAFVLPIFIIIGLVVFVTSGSKPNAGVGNLEMAIAQRIQKVGNVEVRDANRPLRAGEAVYNGQCAACHATGAAGARRGVGPPQRQGPGEGQEPFSPYIARHERERLSEPDAIEHDRQSARCVLFSPY